MLSKVLFYFMAFCRYLFKLCKLISIKANDFLKISRAINKKFYPDFDPIYETVHMDEQSPHVHVRLSGMNNKTKH